MNETQEPNTEQTAPDTHSANPGYVLGQLARAFTTSQTHEDPATRERAAEKIVRWIQVFQGMLSGALTIGSRTPVAATPAWATLEVVKGGFATGSLLAAGPVQPHEAALLETLPSVAEGTERAAINSYYLSDAGFPVLRDLLISGRYRIHVPEEGALLVVAWLLEHGHDDQARALLDLLGPFMARLRFYPVPAPRPLQTGTTVYRQDVGRTIDDLRAIRVRKPMARQREDILIWAPLYDRAVALFAETVEGTIPFVPLGPDSQPLRSQNGHFVIEGGWPCQLYSEGWSERAIGLLEEYKRQRSTHQLSQKPERATENFALLRAYLTRCVDDASQLTGREVGQIRAILAAFALRRGLPGSTRHQELRRSQMQQATAPTTADLARVLIDRLAPLPQDEGLASLDEILAPMTVSEARQFGVTADQPVPQTLADKVQRCLEAPLEVLVERGIIPSSEVLARIVPQLSAYVRVAAVADGNLRRLYSALYTAFRRRRSLLLFNLQHQVKFDELPWVKAIEAYRTRDEDSRELARQLLQRVVTLAITTFPQQIFPNTLLREIRALAESAGLTLPLVDEVAADIFMGEFSEKYLRAAQQAGTLLEVTLYERYYGISYAQVRQIDDVRPSRYGTPTSDDFARLCRELAGETDGKGRWSVARNGKIIEQEQILTTHNLAVLFDSLGLVETLGPMLDELARRCFIWICAQQQQRRDSWHAKLRMLKNSAYAWRQMIFFLALLPDEQVQSFLSWADQHLGLQPAAFQARFRPALEGLNQVAAGAALDPVAQSGDAPATRRFLGWTTEPHWLMP
jgi:hypothetical protein